MNGTAYLDHAATTPVRQVALDAMYAAWQHPGNPSSLHGPGRAARARVEESRETLADALGAHPSEIVFTSGGTESDNLAILGTYRARRAANPRRTRLVVASFEHHAVLEAVDHLVEREGAAVTWVAPSADGIVDSAAVEAALGDDPSDVALVSVMWANNEIGTIAPIADIVAVAHAHGIPVHSDAVQAFGHIPVDFAASGLDLMTVTAHKLGGPVGTGALVAQRGAVVEPIGYGGGQERDLRSGTLDAAGVAGFAAAAAEAVAELSQESARLVVWRDRLVQGALAIDPLIEVTGAYAEGDVARRLPGNAHLLIPDTDSEAVLFVLDRAGVACSTGSACRAGVARTSHVLKALGRGDFRGTALRLTLGHTSSKADVDAFLAALPEAIAAGRRALAVAQ